MFLSRGEHKRRALHNSHIPAQTDFSPAPRIWLHLPQSDSTMTHTSSIPNFSFTVLSYNILAPTLSGWFFCLHGCLTFSAFFRPLLSCTVLSFSFCIFHFLITEDMFPYCSPIDLDINVRRPRILEQLETLRADICCLQVVVHFSFVFKKNFLCFAFYLSFFFFSFCIGSWCRWFFFLLAWFHVWTWLWGML